MESHKDRPGKRTGEKRTVHENGCRKWSEREGV